MDGFNVLNETGGGFYWGVLVVGLLFVILALIVLGAAIYGFTIDEGGAALIALVVALWLGCISVLVFSEVSPPMQYEVTLKPGAIIDATAWEIVEQRGEIYVLEAKEAK